MVSKQTQEIQSTSSLATKEYATPLLPARATLPVILGAHKQLPKIHVQYSNLPTLCTNSFGVAGKL